VTPYRSNDHAVASALEEQRELRMLETAVRTRRRRAALVLTALFCGVVGMMFFIGSRPAPKRWACHRVEIRYEPQRWSPMEAIVGPGSYVARPPETFQSCEWK
jgi:hypothetical protein